MTTRPMDFPPMDQAQRECLPMGLNTGPEIAP